MNSFNSYNHFEIPVPPEEFGQDGGRFYRYYDTLADEVDRDLVDGLATQLGGLLTFTGLFAGVNATFLALTLPLMSPNPADDTNALLRENNAILLQLALGRNDSLPSPQALPSETFSPTGKVLAVNVLFSVSLTLVLIASFLAVLGRQWLVWYRKRSGGGRDHQRWEQLKRSLGAERWGLKWALDDFLPSVLQIGLIIFCISLMIYLSTLHATLSNVVGTFMCVGLAIFIITGFLAAWDKFCPFQSPLSHLISLISPFIALVLPLAARLAARLARTILWQDMRFLPAPPSSVLLAPRVLTRKRQGEDAGKLHILAIKRVICTSDDVETLLHSVANILAISDSHLLEILAADDEFATRLSDLWGGSYIRTLQHFGRDKLTLATAVQRLYRAALVHVFLSSSEGPGEPARSSKLMFPSDKGSGEQRMLSPSDLVQNVQPNMINAYLSCVAFDCLSDNPISPGVNDFPSPARVDVLLNPTWQRISIILTLILIYSGAHGRSEEEAVRKLRKAYIGDAHSVLETLEMATRSRVPDRTRESQDLLNQYLVPIFTFAGKAAVDSGEIRGMGTYPAAKLLRLSETFIRAEDSPSNFITTGRSLRRELISVLASVRERSDLYYEDKYGKLGTLKELIDLFTSMSPTICSNDDDLDLVSLFNPILRRLQAVIRDPGWVDLDRGDSVSEVERLDELFRDFKAAVASVCRKLKKRDRDPESRWCYWRDEDLINVFAY